MDLKEIIQQSSEKTKQHREYLLNHGFNARLDDGDIEGYDLVLRKPDGDEQSLSPISAALFVTDLPTYRQLALDDLDTSRNEILNVESFPTNNRAYDRLLNVVKNNATVIPFVGAGFSVAANCPSWSNYIVKQAVRAGLDKSGVESRLEEGEHEQVMDEVIEELSIELFQRDFRSEFEGGYIAPALSPSVELIGLFDGCSITTNFDRVLEQCHAEKIPFDEKVVGKDDTGRFLKAIYRGEKYLLKLHGNIDDPRDRILTLAEYDCGYGARSIDNSQPIPRTLSKIFGSYTMLFLGCSLIADRYLKVLKSVYDAEPTFMPEHFAIIPAPDDADEQMTRDRFLAGHGITPIWFSDGDWSRPGDILKLLKAER